MGCYARRSFLHMHTCGMLRYQIFFAHAHMHTCTYLDITKDREWLWARRKNVTALQASSRVFIRVERCWLYIRNIFHKICPFVFLKPSFSDATKYRIAAYIPLLFSDSIPKMGLVAPPARLVAHVTSQSLSYFYCR